MARRPRIIIEGQPHHVVQRGHNRDPVFFEDEDYGHYLQSLQHAAERYECGIHAYCLMTNHIHLLVTPCGKSAGLSLMMQMVGRLYVREINKKYRRSGTLWEDRFKISLVDADDYLLSCMRYIELNPVRARMAVNPGDYNWSSYRANAQGEPDGLVKPHPVYERLGLMPEARRRAYGSLFNMPADHAAFDDIRKAAEGNWVLGREDFREKIERMTMQKTAPSPRGGDRRSDRRVSS